MDDKRFKFTDTPKKNLEYSQTDSELINSDVIIENSSHKNENEDYGIEKNKAKGGKKFKIAGTIFAILFVACCFLMPTSPSVNTSDDAKAALENFMSTNLEIGVRLLSEDNNITGQDLTITHSSPSTENKLHIWDYAAEDGDYVQILVDGVALGDPFMIKNKPKEFIVPTTGEIQILGTRDGGGGITYAVHYEVNGTTYFNGMDVGKGNLYTLIRE